MHNLHALSLGLPGTPLHGLNDFASDPRSTSARPCARSASHPRPGALRRRPRSGRGRRFALRVRRTAPAPAPARADLGA